MVSDKPMRIYKQEGELGGYQLLLPMLAIASHMPRFFPVTYGDCWVFFRHGFASVLLREEGMREISNVFANACQQDFPAEWQTRWHDIDEKLTASSKAIWKLDLSRLSSAELWQRYQTHLELHMQMWAISLFIDALDLGWDQEEITRRQKLHGLSQDEVQILLTPRTQSFMTDLDRTALAVMQKALDEQAFYERFWWVGTDYNNHNEVDRAWIETRATHAHPEPFTDPTTKQEEILKARDLSTNPFTVFQTLALWRDDRKRLNYTGLYGLSRLLSEAFRRKNVDPKLHTYILPSEAEQIFQGSIDVDRLLGRREAGILGCIKGGDPFILEGEEACREFDRLCAFIPSHDGVECKGMVACRGYAKAVARVVPYPQSPSGQAFQTGEIIITSMTRPEFLPLMKKAAAIVTDEGGISCHAAIVSRELNIPCVIGTKVASKLFKDDDILEVDAEAGIVRKV